MAASTYLAQVQQLYIAYFGRPADPIGQAFWANQIDAANGSIAAVLAGFSASTESAALYGNKSTIDKVTAIYLNDFNRAPDAAGLAFWVAQIDSGKVTQAQAAWTIQQSAGAGDAATVQNKLTAATAFTAAITTSAQISGYQGSAAADSARSFLNTVTSVNATATAAVNGAAAAVAAATAGGGVVTNFTLTAGVDNLTGTSGNDVFTADNTGATKQATVADTINGGAGTDTLRVFLATTDTTFATPTLNSVEIVSLNGGALTGATAYTAVAGTTGLVIEAPTVAGATYTVSGQAVTLKSAGTVTGTTTIASATDTAANLTLNGWGSATVAETVALTGAAVATANLTATGANSVITLNGLAALKTLNIAGDKNLGVTLGATSTANLTSVNASTATGNVSVTLDSGTNTVGAFAFTGGAGNDTLTLGSTELTALTAGTQLDGGAGTDTLAITATALIAADYAKLNVVKNFEVLGLATTATTVDASQLTSLKAFAVSATGDTISSLGAGTTVSVGSTVAALALSGVVGNSATEVVVGTATSTAAGITALTLTGGLTTIGLTSNGAAGAANTVGLTNLDNSTINVKGATDLTLTIAGTTTGSKVDASAFTGKLSVTGSAVSDVIIGGTGADKVTLSAGADTITLGAGADTVIFGAAVASTNTSMSTVTDFVAGTDKIDVSLLSQNAGTFTATAVNVSSATTLAAALDLAAAANVTAATGNGVVTWFQFQNNTYVVSDNSAATSYAAATDSVIKLSGLVALTAADVIA